MSYEQALRVLDRARAGEPVTLADINTALELTGDLDHIPFSLADALGVQA